MDYTKLHWHSDWMYSEVYGELENEEEDVVVGLYSLIDFPEVDMYIDTENGKVLEAWVHEEE